MKTFSKAMCVLAVSCLVLSVAVSARAADWPKSTIKIIVPYTAGGGTDLMSRSISTELAKKLGVSVVVENNPGGGGGIAMAKLARAKADGYTIILTTVGAATLTPNSSDVGYTNKEFAPLCQIADVPNVIAVHKDSGIKTLAEYFKKAEAKPGSVNYGTSGAGLTQNVQMEALLLEMGKPGLVTHVPFNGGSQAAASLLGKQIDACVTIVPEVLPNIQNGTFIGLAITSSKRDKALPNVPTLKELGYKIEGGVWYGFAAPAAAPAAARKILEEGIKATVELPAIQEVFTKLGNPVEYLDSAAFKAKWMKNFDENKAVLARMAGKK